MYIHTVYSIVIIFSLLQQRTSQTFALPLSTICNTKFHATTCPEQAGVLQCRSPSRSGILWQIIRLLDSTVSGVRHSCLCTVGQNVSSASQAKWYSSNLKSTGTVKIRAHIKSKPWIDYDITWLNWLRRWDEHVTQIVYKSAWPKSSAYGVA